MEFTSKNRYESDEPDDGSEKKTRKKSVKKRIVAPVPVDTSAIENLHADEVHKKKRKRKSASKAAEKAIKTAGSNERRPSVDGAERPASVFAGAEILGKDGAKKAEDLPNESADVASEQSAVGESEKPKDQIGELYENGPSKASAGNESASRMNRAVHENEVVIPLSDAEDNEGTFFVSDRLRKNNARGESIPDIADSETLGTEESLEPTEPGATNESVAHEAVGESGSENENTDGSDHESDDRSGTKSSRRSGSTTSGGSGGSASGSSGGTTAATGAATGSATTSRARPTSGGSGGGTTIPTGGRGAGYGGGSGGGNVPPIHTANAAPNTPAGNPFNNPNTATAVPFLHPNQAPRSPYRRNRYGFIQGVLLGGVIEHIRHKRREKRMDKAHTAESKQAKKEIAGITHEKTVLEKKIEQLKTNVKVEKAKTNTAEKTQLAQEKKITKLVKAKKEAPAPRMQDAAPRPVPVTNHELPRHTAELKAIEAEEKKKKEAIAQPTAEEVLKVPDSHKIEQSAWHSIEVDKKTGLAVEDQSFQYGEEFKHEQHQETLRKQIADISVESEKVKENYLSQAAVPKQQSSGGGIASQNPLNTPIADNVQPPQPTPASAVSKKVPQRVQQKKSSIEPVDIALWVALFIVIGLIVVLL